MSSILPAVPLSRSRKLRVGHTHDHAFDRPYACTHTSCDKRFTRQEHLRRHQLNRMYWNIPL